MSAECLPEHLQTQQHSSCAASSEQLVCCLQPAEHDEDDAQPKRSVSISEPGSKAHIDYSSVKYKKFALSVEKVLSSFESINEWADMISILSRLSKALLAVPSLPCIPFESLVSKRLAQCLNPALPSGVHQKALETYSIVFEKIGPARLSADFYVYSYGLLPFFRYSSLTIKRHLVPLLGACPEATYPIIESLLPGLEEEGNDFFDAIIEIVSSIKKTTGDPLFYSCVWRCLLFCRACRLAVFNLLSRMSGPILPSGASSRDSKLLINAMSSCLSDPDTLVVRNSLEFLLRYLPMSSELFANKDDLEFLGKSILLVLLRRDISLSRRLFTWLGCGENEPRHADFDSLSIPVVSNVFLKHLFKDLRHSRSCSLGTRTTSEDPDRVSVPFKLLVAILDREELGVPVSKRIVMDLIEGIYDCVSSPKASESLVNSAMIFFDVVDVSIVWGAFATAVVSAGPRGLGKLVKMIGFSMDALDIIDNEAEHVHLPLVLLALLSQLVSQAELEVLSDGLALGCRISRRIPWSFLKQQKPSAAVHGGGGARDAAPEVRDKICSFYSSSIPVLCPLLSDPSFFFTCIHSLVSSLNTAITEPCLLDSVCTLQSWLRSFSVGKDSRLELGILEQAFRRISAGTFE